MNQKIELFDFVFVSMPQISFWRRTVNFLSYGFWKSIKISTPKRKISNKAVDMNEEMKQNIPDDFNLAYVYEKLTTLNIS